VTHSDISFETVYIVDISKYKVECSCYYNIQLGIPCSHILRVKLFLQENNIDNLPIFIRWKKKFKELRNETEPEESDKLLTSKLFAR